MYHEGLVHNNINLSNDNRAQLVSINHCNLIIYFHNIWLKFAVLADASVFITIKTDHLTTTGVFETVELMGYQGYNKAVNHPKYMWTLKCPSRKIQGRPLMEPCCDFPETRALDLVVLCDDHEKLLTEQFRTFTKGRQSTQEPCVYRKQQQREERKRTHLPYGD